MSVEGVKALDAIYGLSSAGNAELAWRFFQIALSTGSEYAQKAAEWVTDKGRMKFCRCVLLCLPFTICPAKVLTLNQHLHSERLTSRSARSTPTWPRRPSSHTPASTVRLASSPSRSQHLDLTRLSLSFCLDPIARRMIAKDLGVEL